MTKRIERICSLLFAVDTFADIGCDHGYCTEYMLKKGWCRRAYITDISADCLKKAEKLLGGYIASGECIPLCTDGLQGVDPETELALIAGMGGMEMSHILFEDGGFIPRNFVLQPMRDTPLLRKKLLDFGAEITRDFTFWADGKFYDLIAGTRAGKRVEYTKAQLDFGRENIEKREEDFLAFLDEQIRKRLAIAERPLNDAAREENLQKLNYLQGVRRGEIK